MPLSVCGPLCFAYCCCMVAVPPAVIFVIRRYRINSHYCIAVCYTVLKLFVFVREYRRLVKNMLITVLTRTQGDVIRA